MVSTEERVEVLASIYRKKDLNYTSGRISKLQGLWNISWEIAKVLSLESIVQPGLCV